MIARALFWRWALIGFAAGVAAGLLNPTTRTFLASGTGPAVFQGLVNLIVSGIALAAVFAVVALLIRLLTGRSL